MAYLNAFASTLPVILLVIFGVVLRRFHFFNDQTIQDVKKLIVTFSMPLVLFNAFSTVRFEARFLWVVAFVFLSCVLVMLASGWLQKPLGMRSAYFPYLMAGYESGMMGYAIYGAIYGIQHVSNFGVVDLGQALFVFFVLVASLERRQNQSYGLANTLRVFLKTPAILAILAGFLFNFTGLYALLTSWPVSNALIEATSLLAGVTMPLVAVVLGYELNFQPGNLRQPLRTVGLRLVVWLTVGLLFTIFVMRRALGLDPLMQAALMLMYILPPPFVVPIYLRGGDPADRDYILNTLSLSSLAALILVVAVRIFFPG